MSQLNALVTSSPWMVGGGLIAPAALFCRKSDGSPSRRPPGPSVAIGIGGKQPPSRPRPGAVQEEAEQYGRSLAYFPVSPALPAPFR